MCVAGRNLSKYKRKQKSGQVDFIDSVQNSEQRDSLSSSDSEDESVKSMGAVQDKVNMVSDLNNQTAAGRNDPEPLAGGKDIPKIVLDSLGRKHAATPHGGKLFQFFASNTATPSTIAQHVNHLTAARKFLKDKYKEDKKNEVHVVDQGSGISVKISCFYF